jgi:hypothetical protein
VSLVEIRTLLNRDSMRDPVSWVETPLPAQYETGALEIRGWVFGRRSPIREVEIVHRGDLLRTVPVDIPRPDVPKAHRKAPEVCGFWTLISVLGLQHEFDVEVRAVREDGTTIPIATIEGVLTRLRTHFEPVLQPIMVTSIGRTGTTWLMRVLASDPRVVVYDAFPYEIRPAKYWLHALRVLAEPANHAESAHWETFNSDIWSVGHNPFYTAPLTDRPELMHWFSRTYVQRLAAFFQRTIDDFYLQVAAIQGQGPPRFFAEKFHADGLPAVAWTIYDRPREVFLVRDFRDVVCSILAFNAKRGEQGFGRDQFDNDAHFVRKIARDATALVDEWRARATSAHLIRYEDLVAEPDQTLRALFEYLGLDHDPSSLHAISAHAGDDAAFARHHRTTADAAASVGRWKRDLPSELREACDAAFAYPLSSFGYA